MDTFPARLSQLHTAVYIDFDNIYLTLAKYEDRQVAEKFASNPDRWLHWLEKVPIDYQGTTFGSRRVLLRRCYLNPNSFSRFRLQFINSGCEVIDCPPLTQGGKTSTDIHMVLDMADALHHDVHFHEFIILSGDADFTPLLLKLRKYGRYSVVLSVGNASPAYKACSDYLINQSAFVENGLGINEQEQETVSTVSEITGSTEELLKRIAARVHQVALTMPSGIPGNDLPELYKEFPDFRQSNSLGFYSLHGLTEAMVQRHDDLTIIEDEDSWFVTRKLFANWLYGAKEAVLTTGPTLPDPRMQITEWLKTLVKDSPSPIALSNLAQSVHNKFPESGAESNWLGAGTFKNLLFQLDLDGLQVSGNAPGYLFDPNRHTLPVNGPLKESVVKQATGDVFSEGYPDLAPLARRIHRLTEMPYLQPDHYALLFREIAREVNERGYQMTRTSRAVRDRCIEAGAPIARSHVNFVLTGISYTGHRFGEMGRIESAEELARLLVSNTYNLCENAQLDLSEADRKSIELWLSSKLETENH
jgi:hypothetical protein